MKPVNKKCDTLANFNMGPRSSLAWDLKGKEEERMNNEEARMARASGG
jgi:hypothetical protein